MPRQSPTRTLWYDPTYHSLSKILLLTYLFQLGNYPEVPFEYYQHRNPYKKYDDQQLRRNFNEPLHQNYDYIDLWSPDRFDAYPDSVAIRNNLIFIALISGFSFTCWYFFYPERVAAPRSYPYGGLYKALGGSEEDKEVYQVSGTIFNLC
ncbi:hypothetical protein DV495_000914 [Geotrichum candidum]|nr:hypothetical protein DV452_000909 [Geotrichum candidum]KAF5135284.1 hypothetical protein DV495_000914 [Geotrichum candidum]KAF7501219.1 hypothetical protein DV113_000791 [Geotrichum candidum]KAI8136136.1 hypothetical protein DUD61_000292 [Geotrichum candidum]KAI9214878.1 hypothetical protein DS838_000209 [Geotrichum bryndzae]